MKFLKDTIKKTRLSNFQVFQSSDFSHRLVTAMKQIRNSKIKQKTMLSTQEEFIFVWICEIENSKVALRINADEIYNLEINIDSSGTQHAIFKDLFVKIAKLGFIIYYHFTL